MTHTPTVEEGLRNLNTAILRRNKELLDTNDALLEALRGLLENSPPPKGVKQDYSYILYREAAKKAIAQAEGGAS